MRNIWRYDHEPLPACTSSCATTRDCKEAYDVQSVLDEGDRGGHCIQDQVNRSIPSL